MKALVVKVARRLAPRTVESLADLNGAREQHGDILALLASLQGRVQELETAVDELREEVDESRRDARRVAELYDLVFERLKSPRV